MSLSQTAFQAEGSVSAKALRQEYTMGLERRESRRGELREVGTIRPSRTLSFTLNKMRTQ